MQVPSLGKKCQKRVNGVKDNIRVQGAFAIPSRGVGDVGGPRSLGAR